MEAGVVALLGVHFDDVDRDAERCPDVVVIDTGGHHIDEGLARSDVRRGHHLRTEGVLRLAERLAADGHRMHTGRDDADGWRFADGVEVAGNGAHVRSPDSRFFAAASGSNETGRIAPAPSSCMFPSYCYGNTLTEFGLAGMTLDADCTPEARIGIGMT